MYGTLKKSQWQFYDSFQRAYNYIIDICNTYCLIFTQVVNDYNIMQAPMEMNHKIATETFLLSVKLYQTGVLRTRPTPKKE